MIWLAIAGVGGALALLSNFDLSRAIADALAPDGEAATFSPQVHGAMLQVGIFVSVCVAAALLLNRASGAASAVSTRPFACRTTLVWIASFSAVLFVSRLGSFGAGSRVDEPTFLIMASHVLDGNLPYVELSDNKPPGIFLVLAGVMYLFGEQLLVVRVFAATCLLVSAVAGYAVSLRFASPSVAGLAMTVCCALVGIGTLQMMLTEHLALALLMPAVWLLVARRDRLWSAFVVGMLVCLATLVRTNLAYVAFVLGVFYLWRCVSPRVDVPRWAISAYVLGGCLPLSALLLVYWWADALQVFVVSTVHVALAYAYNQASAGEVFLGFFVVVARFGELSPWLTAAAMLYFGLGLAAHFVGAGHRAFRGDVGLALLVLGAVSLSILTGGTASGYQHYLLQVFPLALVIAAAGWETIRRERRVGGAILCGFSVFIVGAVVARYAGEGLDYLRHGPSSDWRTAAAEAIGRDSCCGRLVYAPQGQIIHWYLGQRPPSYIVNPNSRMMAPIVDTLARHGYVARDEWRQIFERDIGYVVLMGGLDRLRHLTPEQRRYVGSVLERRFCVWKEIGELTIFRARTAGRTGAPEKNAESLAGCIRWPRHSRAGEGVVP